MSTSADLLFAALASRSPETVVLRGETSVWTASDLLAEIDNVAEQLSSVSVLGLLSDNSPDWAIADLAALRSSTPLLPLPTFFTPDQLAHALKQSGSDTVLTDQPERIAALSLGFSVTSTHSGLTWLRRQVTAVEQVQLPTGTAKISYTSGSTGTPKGVCLTVEGLLDTAKALTTRLADLPIARHLSVLPLSLLLENSAGIYAPILRGAEIHLPGLASLGWQGMAGFSPEALQAKVAEVRPNSLILVPELLKAWLLYLKISGQQAPAGLSYVAVGGSRVEHAMLIEARRLGIPAYQGYGLTECGSVVSLNRPGDDGDDAGRPLPHVRVVIRQDEIHVTTRAFLGYLGDPETAAETSFATGDLGHFDDSGKTSGHLRLSGRRKNLLITSFGRNISPEWVESVLAAQPEIAQSIVCGDGQNTLSAVIVPFRGVDAAALTKAIARANAVLPDYACIGHWITTTPFTAQNGLATGNGRPVRSSILNQYAAELAAVYQTSNENEETAHVLL